MDKSPISYTSANYCTYRFWGPKKDYLFVRPTSTKILIRLIAFSILMFLASFFHSYLEPVAEFFSLFLLLAACITLVTIHKPFIANGKNSVIQLYWFRRGMVFVKGTRAFRQPFDRVKAIQLIKKFNKGSESSSEDTYTYEMNVVLKDESRINILSHGAFYLMREDGQKLANFVNVPLDDFMGWEHKKEMP